MSCYGILIFLHIKYVVRVTPRREQRRRIGETEFGNFILELMIAASIPKSIVFLSIYCVLMYNERHFVEADTLDMSKMHSNNCKMLLKT